MLLICDYIYDNDWLSKGGGSDPHNTTTTRAKVKVTIKTKATATITNTNTTITSNPGVPKIRTNQVNNGDTLNAVLL